MILKDLGSGFEILKGFESLKCHAVGCIPFSVTTAFGWQLLVQEIHGMAAYGSMAGTQKWDESQILVHRCAPVGPIFFGAMDVEGMSFQRQPFHVRSGGYSNIYIYIMCIHCIYIYRYMQSMYIYIHTDMYTYPVVSMVE